MTQLLLNKLTGFNLKYADNNLKINKKEQL